MTAIEKMRRAMHHAAMNGSWRPVVQRDPCVYCCAWPQRHAESDRMTLEHIQPQSVGGRSEWKNLVGAHQGCNESRSSMPLLHFLIYRQRLCELSGKRNRVRRLRLRRQIWQPVTKEGKP